MPDTVDPALPTLHEQHVAHEMHVHDDHLAHLAHLDHTAHPSHVGPVSNIAAGDLNLSQFMAGLRKVENGGSYSWGKNRAGAQGAYQFTNYAGWARDAGVNPNDHSPAAQDAVAAHKIQQYLKSYNGNWAMVAAAWLGGPGGAHTWASGEGDPSDGNLTTSQYVSKVLSAAGSVNPNQYIPSTATYTGTGTGANQTPGAVGTPQPLTVGGYLDNPAIAQQYGYLSAYLKDPEVGPILAKAAQQGWGENQLLGALEATRWWKTTAESARAWQSQQRLDPATANQRVSQMTAQIQQQAQATLGYSLTANRAASLANTAIAQNWTAGQLQTAIGAEFHYKASGPAYGGQAGQTISQLKQRASDYLVPISDQTIGKWTKGVLEGTYTPADFDSYLKAQAKSLYPTLAGALDKGDTVSQYLDPYKQLVQSTLGVNPDGVNWMDPKWVKALNTTTPDGQRAPMSLSDWSTYLRGLPEYKTTQQAKQTSSDFALNIAQTFGKVG